MNEYEILVLKMMNGDIPWESGAWVNACVEYLKEGGYCTQEKITDKGKDYLSSLA